jgi:hypothetical protein
MVLGLMILIKPHAVFLVPGVAAFLFLKRKQTSTFLTLFLFSITLLFARIGLGVYLAGNNSLSFSGSLYNQIAETTLREQILSINFLQALMSNISGHFFVISVVFGLGIQIIANANPFRFETLKNNDFLFLSTTLLLPLILVSAAFSALTPNLGLYESYFRISSRYYAFALPLVLIQFFCDGKIQRKKISGLLNGTFLVFLVAPLATGIFYRFEPVLTDNPELAFLRSSNVFGYILISIAIALSLLFFHYSKEVTRIYLYVYLPLIFSLIFLNSTQIIQANKVQNPYDAAGQITRQLFDNSDYNQIQVIGDSTAGSFNYLFQTDSIEPLWITREQGSLIQNSDINQGRNVLFLIGAYQVEFTYEHKVLRDGYSIYWLGN